METSVSLWQVILGGVFAFFTALATGYFGYRQATKVAERESNTSVEVKRLEIVNTQSGWVHEELTRCREQVATLSVALRECEQQKFAAEARREYNEKQIADLSTEILKLEEERKALIAHGETIEKELSECKLENISLETKMRGYDWIRETPEALRAMANQREQELRQLPPAQPPTGAGE